MSQMSNYLEDALRTLIFRTGAGMAKPTHIYVALVKTNHVDDAMTGSTITEPAGGIGYARQQLDPLDANWTAASATDGLTDNASDIVFGPATGDWGTIIDVAIVDAATGGNLLFYGQLTTPLTVNSGSTFKFLAGDLNVTFA